MNKIGVMGALPEEVALFAAALESPRAEVYAGVEYTTGRRGALTLVVCCAGMGKVNAAQAAQVLITRYGVEGILFNGIAGNMCDAISVGDMVIGQSLLHHDATRDMLAQSAPGCEEYAADPRMVAAAEAACRAAGVRYVKGRIATGDQFVGDPATKRAIMEDCAPLCVEMEGAAVGQVALRNGVPFVVVRTMSDNSDESREALNARQFEIEQYLQKGSAVVLAAVDALAGQPADPAESRGGGGPAEAGAAPGSMDAAGSKGLEPEPGGQAGPGRGQG